jgi:hypothetical protein
VNDPPVLPALANAQLTEGERWVYQVVFSDPDLDVDPGEGHTFTVEPPLFAIAASGLVDFMPTNDHVGTHDLVVTVTDADGLNSSQVWRVVVRNVNQPPTIDRVEPQVWNEDEPVLLQIVGQDPDRGDVLTFSDTSSMFDIDPRTGLINFTPTQANVGSYSVQVRAQDRDGLYVTLTFDVTVVARNDPPVVSIRVETLKAHLREGDSVSLAADVEDEDTPRGEMGYKWTLDGKVRGVDDTLVLRNLRPGTHKVVLVVDDGTSKITAEHEFKVEAVEEPFPWGALVTAIVVLAVVATVALMFLLPRLRGREDDAEGGPGRDGEPGPKGP